MEDAVRALRCGAHGRCVGDIAHDQTAAGGEVAARACRQVVEDADPVAQAEQRVAKVRPDEAGAAGDEGGGHANSERNGTGCVPGW